VVAAAARCKAASEIHGAVAAVVRNGWKVLLPFSNSRWSEELVVAAAMGGRFGLGFQVCEMGRK